MGAAVTQTITLAGKSYDVSPLSLGKLKKVIPAFNRAGAAFAAGIVDEAAMQDVVVILSGALNLDADAVEALPATMDELVASIDVIAAVCGLKPAPDGSAAGEAVRAVASIGTNSTPG